MEIGTVRRVDIDTEMQEAYLDYAMSVIVSRALPDVRDGLKPVHRRILYAMHDMGLRPTGPYKKSARIVGECFVKDTLVATQRGLVPIQDVHRGDGVYTEHGTQTVLELYEMPPQPLYEIELENGLRNVVTPSQAFRVCNPDLSCSWKKAEDLAPGDWIVLKMAYPDLESAPSLSLYKGAEKALNSRIAYLLGLLMADGWVAREGDRRRLGFYSAEREIVERVARLLREEVGYKATIETKEYTHHSATGAVALHQGYTVRINSDELNTYFVDHFDLADIAAPTKYIPPQILQAPKDVVFAFLSGLIDGDGSVHRERNVIHYGSISARLIEHLQILLHHLGILSHRYVDQRTDSSEQTFYWLEVTGTAAQRLAEMLDLAHPVKRQYLAQMQHRITKQLQHDQIPYASQVLFDELSRHHLGGGWYQGADGHKFRQGIAYPGGTKIRYSRDLKDRPIYRKQLVDWGIMEKLERIGSPYAEQAAHFLHDHIAFARVKRVLPHKPEKTYDIQVSHDHMFVAHGMVVHNCLGKYHPHGDQAVYEAMVRLAQDFSMRYTLVDGQGNFGSIDGDNPAAMRYTEARLAPMAEEMLADLEKETVNFGPNFDGTLNEPLVLPAAFPNLLVNGSAGIAVGMATNIPPHNLGEVCDALVYMIDHYKKLDDISAEDLMRFIKGPDFPTGGIVYRYGEGDGDGEQPDLIHSAYAMGHGRITVQAKTHIEEMSRSRHRIVVTELPYQVNKSRLIERIAELVREGRLEGIADLRDESDRQGMRLVIELTRTVEPRQVLSFLFKLTPLQDTFGIRMLALVKGEPRLLPLKRALQYYIEHRLEIIVRRSRYELERAKERAHILEGLLVALNNLDEVIALIRRSRDVDTARTNLQRKFKLSQVQAQAILDMPLRRLAALERKKLEQEYKEKQQLIKYLQGLLRSPSKILALIKEELLALKGKYGDARRTQIVEREKGELTARDLLPEEEVLISITWGGIIKRESVAGKRQIAPKGQGKDATRFLLLANTRDDLAFFTAGGQACLLPVHQIPDVEQRSAGTPVAGLWPLGRGEELAAVVALPGGEAKEEEGYLVLATQGGKIKRIALADFVNAAAKGGVTAMGVDRGDELRWARLAQGGQELILVTRNGQAIRFSEEDVRPMGLTAAGVMAIKLADGDQIVAVDLVQPRAQLLVATTRGYAKRTPLADFPLQKRYGSGVVAVNPSARVGEVAVAKVVYAKDKVAFVSAKGALMNLTVQSVAGMGRSAQGKAVMQLKDGDSLAAIVALEGSPAAEE